MNIAIADITIFAVFNAVFFISIMVQVSRIYLWTRKRDAYYAKEIEKSKEFSQFVKETSELIKDVHNLIKK